LGNATREARMTKLAIALLVLATLFLFVDHQHRLLAEDIYCWIGAGELRQTRPPARGAGTSNQSATGNQYCLHGSGWDAIMNAITGRQFRWKQDTLRDD
jgi:hypothetical protein